MNLYNLYIYKGVFFYYLNIETGLKIKFKSILFSSGNLKYNFWRKKIETGKNKNQ